MLIEYPIERFVAGDQLVVPFNLCFPRFQLYSLADATFRANFKQTEEGPTSLFAGAYITFDSTELGRLKCVLAIPGNLTDLWFGKYFCDVRVEVPSLGLGPITALRIVLNVIKSFTP